MSMDPRIEKILDEFVGFTFDKNTAIRIVVSQVCNRIPIISRVELKRFLKTPFMDIVFKSQNIEDTISIILVCYKLTSINGETLIETLKGTYDNLIKNYPVIEETKPN